LRWVVLRLSADGSTSAAAFPLGMAIVVPQQWWLAAIAAGVGAPLLLRTQVKFVGKGGSVRDFGPEVLYRKIRDLTDSRIDKFASSVDSNLVIDQLAPAMASISIDRFSRKIENYFKLLEINSGSSKKAELDYIKGQLKKLDGASLTESIPIYEAIAVQLIAYGHREFIEDLLKGSPGGREGVEVRPDSQPRASAEKDSA
jgi:hypothetical protein